METHIKNKLIDITYQSELTHTPSQHKKMAMGFWVWGLIRAYNLRRTFSASVSYALIKGGVYGKAIVI